MQSNYTSLNCKSCNREIILLTNEMEEAKKHGSYLACTYCSSKRLDKTKETYDLKECFKNSEKVK